MQLKLTILLFAFVVLCLFSGFSQSIEKKAPEKINYTLSLSATNIHNKLSFIEDIKNQHGVISCNAIKESSVEIIYQADVDFSAVIKEKMLTYGLIADRFETAIIKELKTEAKPIETTAAKSKSQKKIK